MTRRFSVGLFQLEAVVEGPAYCLAQDPVDVVDGIKGDGLEPGGVDPALLVQHRFVGADVDDLAHHTAAPLS